MRATMLFAAALLAAIPAAKAQSTSTPASAPSANKSANANPHPANPALSCPATIDTAADGTVSSGPPAPWKVQWKGAKAAGNYALAGITIYNGDFGDETASLAPDEESHRWHHYTQTWRVKDYHDRNVWLQCRYRLASDEASGETPLALAANVPGAIRSCVFAFDLDRKGNVTGSTDLQCR